MSTITTKDADDIKHHCAACGDSDVGGGRLKACTACNLVKYCNRTCQVAHWPAHKKACKKACKKRRAKHHYCAACGDSDDGGGSLKACTGCSLVEYCNRTCQAAHWPAHKKACKERAAELFDEKLFKQPPPNDEDCPICHIRLPIKGNHCTYEPCCGTILCNGCAYAHADAPADTEKGTCVFCRSEASSSDEERIERIKERVEDNDAWAIYNLGKYYQFGMKGLRQDHSKTLELFHESAKLGHHPAHYDLSVCYREGGIIERDTRKATHHGQLAAMAGNVHARYNLGCDEYNAGNMDRAYKHLMISANDGCDLSMKEVQEGYRRGFVTKDDYAETIRAYGNSIDQMKSDDRDRAAAALLLQVHTQLTKTAHKS